MAEPTMTPERPLYPQNLTDEWLKRDLMKPEGQAILREIQSLREQVDAEVSAREQAEADVQKVWDAHDQVVRERDEAREALEVMRGGWAEHDDRRVRAENDAVEARAERDDAVKALEAIRDLAEWYADQHAGPELEVHHALKVEVLDLADSALARIQEPKGETEECRR